MMSETNRFREAQSVVDYGSEPVGTKLLGSDDALTAAAAGINANLTAGEYKFIDVTLAQFTGPAEWNTLYIVFNSADSTTDLAARTVREELHLQNGIGETKRFTFDSATPLITMIYNPRTTSANISVNWAYK